MKSIIKKLVTLTLAATLSLTTLALPVTATWETTDNGKQWVNTDGTIAKSKWLKMKNGDRYYIKSNGLTATGLLNLSEKVDGTKVKNTYYFDKNGKMQTGWQYVNKKYYYFDTETGRAYKNTTQKIGDYTYKFDANGNWDKKVLKNGKDVTAKVDIAKLTGITEKQGNTVVIAGKEYSTKLKELTINKEGVTDEDLENLKYMTNLRTLNIVPGAPEGRSSSAIFYDYTDVKFIEYDDSCTIWREPRYTYAFNVVARNTSIAITNLDFCAYMPKLEFLNVGYATKLTDISGLSKLKKLCVVEFYNCTALKDLKALSTENFSKSYSDIIIGFSDNVKFAFTDYHYGARIKTTISNFWVEPAKAHSSLSVMRELKTVDDYQMELFSMIPYTKGIRYYSGKLNSDTYTK